MLIVESYTLLDGIEFLSRFQDELHRFEHFIQLRKYLHEIDSIYVILFEANNQYYSQKYTQTHARTRIAFLI